MKYIMLSLLYSITIIVFSCLSSFAQGAWDLKYLPIDSLNSSFTNKDIRIDFKTSVTDILLKKVDIFDVRYLLTMKDTVKIKIKNDDIIFIENWILYPDEGVLKEQSLISINKYWGKKLVIKEMILLSVNDSKITLNVHLYNTRKIPPDKEHIMNSRMEKIIIDKSTVKGFLIKL